MVFLARTNRRRGGTLGWTGEKVRLTWAGTCDPVTSLAAHAGGLPPRQPPCESGTSDLQQLIMKGETGSPYQCGIPLVATLGMAVRAVNPRPGRSRETCTPLPLSAAACAPTPSKNTIFQRLANGQTVL